MNYQRAILIALLGMILAAFVYFIGEASKRSAADDLRGTQQKAREEGKIYDEINRLKGR